MATMERKLVNNALAYGVDVDADDYEIGCR